MELLEEIKKLKDEINDIAEEYNNKINYYYDLNENVNALVAVSKYNILNDISVKLEKIIEKYEEND